MGGSESTQTNAKYANPQMMYYGPSMHRPVLRSCEYQRQTNVGQDDLFGDSHLKVFSGKTKELDKHPNAMRSNGQLKNIVDMSTSSWDCDNTNAYKYRPKKNMLTHGKQSIPNVTAMSKYSDSEFGTGPNKVDSVDKHCGYRVKSQS